MPPTTTKCRQKGTKERGPYTPKPVQGRVIALHRTGQSNRRIARAEGIDRGTVGRILTQREVVEMIAQDQQRLLGLVPKAIEVLCDALSSGDERIRVAVATKLMESLQVMQRGGSGQIADVADQASSSPLEESHRLFAVKAQLMTLMLEKHDRFGIPLPEPLVQMSEAAEAQMREAAKAAAQKTASSSSAKSFAHRGPVLARD